MTGLRVPTYGTAALSDVLPSVLTALGVPGFRDVFALPEVRRACVLLVDGLGHEMLREHPDEAPFLSDAAAHDATITVGFPSTTATSLASLATGAPPGEHGFVGYTFLVPGAGLVVNTLSWTAWGGERHGQDLAAVAVPERVQPRATLFELAARSGVSVSRVGPGAHEGTGLTRALMRGGLFAGTGSVDDLVAFTLDALVRPAPSLVYAYHPDLDAAGHFTGVGSDTWKQELRVVDALVRRIAEGLPPDAALLVTGDHGMTVLREEDKVDLRERPELRAGLRHLGGEARARHLYVEDGAAEDVAAAWGESLGGRMRILLRREAIAAGLFGSTVTQEAERRIGDVLAIATTDVGVFDVDVEGILASLVGHHGALTERELLVPLLVFRP